MSQFDEFLKNSKSATVQEVQKTAQRRKRRVFRFPEPAPFYINKIVTPLPPETKRWIRNAADERAAEEKGCRFSEEAGMFVVNWIESNCILYEGDAAGEYMSLEDWQYELEMQTFGWQWWSEHWANKRQDGNGWVRRYRKVSGWVPKKNTKSPTLAANGFYMFAGDGEMGQKCFSLATDREQAEISHKHATNFVNQHPLLGKRFKVNGTDLEITDTWTQSLYKILCGTKGSFTFSKEGINGSLFVDETHVVNEIIMGVVQYAGASRRQPLHMQLSTAGSDTQGYGYKQYIFGQENIQLAEKGGDYDFRYYHFEYAIPQSTSIDDLRDATKIEGLIKRSNPTLGRVIVHDEIKQEWINAKKSDTGLIRFAMYRLNQWNSSGGAFVAGSDWDRCRGAFRFKDLEKYPLVVGLDLTRCKDMAASVCMWAVPKKVVVPIDPYDPYTEYEEREIIVPYIKPFFWLPERTAHLYAGKINLEELASKKQIYLTKSPTVKAEVVAEHLNMLDQRFELVGVAADRAYSAALGSVLETTFGWDVKGEETRLHLIPQTFTTIGPAVEQLESCVLNQELVQDGNDVMKWQLGNIVVVEDTFGNRRIEKPTHDDYRKIDGWAALLNGTYFMMNTPNMYPGSSMSIKVTA